MCHLKIKVKISLLSSNLLKIVEKNTTLKQNKLFIKCFSYIYAYLYYFSTYLSGLYLAEISSIFCKKKGDLKMFTISLPTTIDEIKEVLSNENKKVSVRRVLPKSVIIALHKQSLSQVTQIAGTHKAIQTYTTTPLVPTEDTDFIKILFGSGSLPPTEVLNRISKKTGLNLSQLSALSRTLPQNVKNQLKPSIDKLLAFGKATSRELPETFLVHAQQAVAKDIRDREPKLDDEVTDLLKFVREGLILQIGVMLNVIQSTPQPFCVLNRVKYDISERHFRKYFDCYVLLYAKKVFDKEGLSNIAVWTQLHPVDSKNINKISKEHISSDVKYVDYPEGLVFLQFADTAVQVELSSLEQSPFLLDAKPMKQVIDEMKYFVRTMQAPGKKKPGIALQVTAAHCPDKSSDLENKNVWL